MVRESINGCEALNSFTAQPWSSPHAQEGSSAFSLPTLWPLTPSSSDDPPLPAFPLTPSPPN